MGAPVGDIVELIGPYRAIGRGLGEGFGEAGGIFHVVVGVLVRNRWNFDQLRAEQFKRVLLLLALRHRDDNHRLKAHGVGDDSQAYSGIAGGALNNGAARFQCAFGDRVLDDEQGGAVLDGLARDS